MVLVRHLPADSSVGILGHDEPPWTRDQVLLADVWQQVARSKTPHPSLRQARKQATTRQRQAMTPERRQKLADARRRARVRRLAIDRAEIP